MRSVASMILGAALCVGCSGGHDDDVVDCEKETRDDDFVIGLEKVGNAGRLGFRLMATTPSPQAAGDNEWIILINTMSNGSVVGPLINASMSVTPFMPDHGHVSPSSVIVTPDVAPGQYKMTPVNTWMPGLWETTIDVTGMGGDRVVFKTCIPS